MQSQRAYWLKSSLLMLMMVSIALAWQQGQVTRTQLLSEMLTDAAKCIGYYNTTYTWSETAGDWSNAPNTSPNTYNEKPNTNWVDAAVFLALDGTDAQVALTGLTRDELIRRARLPKTFSENVDATLLNKIKAYDQTTWATAVANAATAWNLPRLKSTFPEKAKIVRLGFTDGMTGGRAQKNCITMRPVPQDFADPRLISGRPIKDWMRNWKCTRLANGVDADTGTLAVASYSPDFGSDFNGNMNLRYQLRPDVENGTHFTEMFTRMLDGLALDDRWTDTLTHMDESHFYSMQFITSDGYGSNPEKATDLVFHNCVLEPVICATLFKNREALAFVQRTVESMKRGYCGYLQTFLSGRTGAYAYLLLRLIPDYPDIAPEFSEAKRVMDGTQWFRPHQFVMQRTPEKFVSVAWNQMIRIAKTKAWGTGQFRDQTPQIKAISGRWDVIMSLIPDNANDSLIINPQSYSNIPLMVKGSNGKAGGGLQGEFDGVVGSYRNNMSRGAPSSSGVRVDRTDAMFSTARRTCIIDNVNDTGPYIETGVQYQSFTSFADKICISMVQAHLAPEITAASYGNYWHNGFSLCFNVHKTNPNHPVMCTYEGNKTVDLNSRTLMDQVLNTQWYSVNDQVGVGVVGGHGSMRWWDGYSVQMTGEFQRLATDVGYFEPISKISDTLTNLAAVFFVYTQAADVKRLTSAAITLDAKLPLGWKGLVVPTPDSQRVMALARFYGTDGNANLSMHFDEGAPIFERLTTFSNDSGKATFAFDTLESWGQTLAFYASGAVTEAEQIGDLAVRLKGNGQATLKYLSRAASNIVDVNGTKSTKTKAELRTGLTLTLADSWTTVRIENAMDDDHSGPAVEVKSPQYLTDEQCKLLGLIANDNFPDPDKVIVPDEGLRVKISAKDRSGISWVKVYLDWDSVGIMTQEPYELVIPKSKLVTDSIHAIHAVACDQLGHKTQSVSSPFKIAGSGVGIERMGSNRMISPATVTARTAASSSKAMTSVSGSSKTDGISCVAGIEGWLAQGRVKPNAGKEGEVCGLTFNHNGSEFVLSLNAGTNKLSLFRKGRDANTLIGETVMRVSTGKWYELKIKTVESGLAGFVNGEEMLVVKQ